MNSASIDMFLLGVIDFINTRILSASTIIGYIIWLLYSFTNQFYDFNIVEQALVYNVIFGLVINRY